MLNPLQRLIKIPNLDKFSPSEREEIDRIAAVLVEHSRDGEGKRLFLNAAQVIHMAIGVMEYVKR